MRESGILMHITSLPGPYGVGTMGKQAYEFVDFLHEAGQRCWQILPLTPTGYGDSPYQSCSTFAGNHYLIDLDTLIWEGLLEKSDVEGIDWYWSETKTDYGRLYNNRLNVLRIAYSRFQGGEAFDAFCMENAAFFLGNKNCIVDGALTIDDAVSESRMLNVKSRELRVMHLLIFNIRH